MISNFIWNYYNTKVGHFKLLTCKVLFDVFTGNNMIMESI